MAAAGCTGACAAGSFAPAGAVACALCSPGNYSLAAWAQCAPCAAGYHCPQPGASTGQGAGPCPAGSFSYAGAATCAACPPGRFSTAVGALSNATCAPCAPGKYSAAWGANASNQCIDCGRGTYSNASGAASPGACTNCTAGRYSNATGQTLFDACAPCPAGRFLDFPGAPSIGNCTACAAGTFNSTPGASLRSHCAPCPANYFAADTASTACSPCAAGRELPLGLGAPGAASPALCRQCPVKSVSAAGGPCSPCPAGQITSGGGQAECFALNPECAAGFTARAPGLGAQLNPALVGGDCVPLACPSFLLPSELACLGCPQGAYGRLSGNASAPDNSTCARCPSGGAMLCPGFLPLPLAPPLSFRERARAGAGAGCVAATTLPAVGASFATQGVPLPLQLAIVGTVCGLICAIGALCRCSGRARSCLRASAATDAFALHKVPAEEIAQAPAQPAFVRDVQLRVVAAKQTPLGGFFFLGFVLMLGGVWTWLLLNFFSNNVTQTSAVVFQAAPEALAALRWAAPATAAAAALRPPLPPGVNLQLRVFGDARLGCGAPLPLNYAGVADFEGVAWDPSADWLLQPQTQALGWVWEQAPGCAQDVSLFTLSCFNCSLSSTSSIAFSLNVTCQSFFGA